MPLQDQTPVVRPTAAWISRYAAGLLASTPGMHPLDAVRLAMDASEGPGKARAQGAARKEPAYRGTARR